MTPTRRLDEDTVARAAHAVAGAFGFSLGLLLGRSRAGRLPEARFALYRLLREADARATLHDIGRLLRRDHGAILHGLRRADALASAYRDYAERLAAARDIFAGTARAEPVSIPRHTTPAKRFPWL